MRQLFSQRPTAYLGTHIHQNSISEFSYTFDCNMMSLDNVDPFREFNRCEESSAKVERSRSSLKDVEELMAKFNVRITKLLCSSGEM